MDFMRAVDLKITCVYLSVEARRKKKIFKYKKLKAADQCNVYLEVTFLLYSWSNILCFKLKCEVWWLKDLFI